MRPISVAGAVLIAAGVLALLYQGITYTTRETVIDTGPIHATVDREKTVWLAPALGIVTIAAGVVLMGAGARTRM